MKKFDEFCKQIILEETTNFNKIKINNTDNIKRNNMIHNFKIFLTAIDDIETDLSCGQLNKYDYDNDEFLCGASYHIATNYYGKLFKEIKDIDIQQQLLSYNKKITDEIADRSNAIRYKVDAEYRIYYVMKNSMLPYLNKLVTKYKQDFLRLFNEDISDFI